MTLRNCKQVKHPSPPLLLEEEYAKNSEEIEKRAVTEQDKEE